MPAEYPRGADPDARPRALTQPCAPPLATVILAPIDAGDA